MMITGSNSHKFILICIGIVGLLAIGLVIGCSPAFKLPVSPNILSPSSSPAQSAPFRNPLNFSVNINAVQDRT